MNKISRLFCYTVLFSILFVADRLTKFWAINKLYYEDYMVAPFFNLSLSLNRGISWGMLSFDSKKSFLFLSIFIFSIIGVFAFYSIKRFLIGKNIIPEVMILSGAISNFLDRIFYGSVIDFIELHIKKLYWPTFNIADSMIVLGVIIMIWRNWFYEDI